MFKKFVKIPGESATERYDRFLNHQREALKYAAQVNKERDNAERAKNTNFSDLFILDSADQQK